MADPCTRRVNVIVPPAPIVTPADISGDHAADDALIAAMIQAATEEIDGPDGWLQRCLGPQTLELSADAFPCAGSVVISLPCPPLIEVVSIVYRDAAGADHTVPASSYGKVGARGVYPKAGFPWPSANGDPEAVRIRYRAGYDGTTTGPVPERARQAIILGVRELQAVGAENLFLRSEEVEGVGSQTFTVSDVAGRVLRTTAERLLSTLRVYA